MVWSSSSSESSSSLKKCEDLHNFYEDEEEEDRGRVLKEGNNNVRLIRSERNANVYGTTGLLMS